MRGTRLWADNPGGLSAERCGTLQGKRVMVKIRPDKSPYPRVRLEFTPGAGRGVDDSPPSSGLYTTRPTDLT